MIKYKISENQMQEKSTNISAKLQIKSTNNDEDLQEIANAPLIYLITAKSVLKGFEHFVEKSLV